MKKRLIALSGVTTGVAALVIGLAPAAQAASAPGSWGCLVNKIDSPQGGYSVCTRMPSGKKQKVGVDCKDGFTGSVSRVYGPYVTGRSAKSTAYCNQRSSVVLIDAYT